MRPRLRACPRFDVLLNLVPILPVFDEPLEELGMFLIRPLALVVVFLLIRLIERGPRSLKRFLLDQ